MQSEYRSEYRSRRILGTVWLCAPMVACGFAAAVTIAEGQVESLPEFLPSFLAISIPYVLIGSIISMPLAYLSLRALTGSAPRRPAAVVVATLSVLVGLRFADALLDKLLGGGTFGNHVYVPKEGYILAGIVSAITAAWHWRTR